MSTIHRITRATALLAAAAACRSGQVHRVSTGPVAEAERQARDAIANERLLAGRTPAERTVGVTPFGTAVRDTALAPLAYGLADLLLTDLARSRRLVVVERARLDALLRELDLARSGRVDSATAPRVGRLVQARHLVLGTLSELPGQQLRIDTRVADVGTADIGRPLAFSAPLARVLEAEKALALRLLEELGVAPTPQQRAELEQPATRSFDALLAFSRGVRHAAERRFTAAAAEYDRALRLDPGFAHARTRLGEARSAIAADARASRSGRDLRRAAGELALEQVHSIMPPSIVDRPGGAADSAFPTTRAFIVINVRPR